MSNSEVESHKKHIHSSPPEKGQFVRCWLWDGRWCSATYRWSGKQLDELYCLICPKCEHDIDQWVPCIHSPAIELEFGHSAIYVY